MVVFPGKKIGGESNEKVERQEQAEDAEEFGNPFAVKIHTQLSAFSRSHAMLSRFCWCCFGSVQK